VSGSSGLSISGQTYSEFYYDPTTLYVPYIQTSGITISNITQINSSYTGTTTDSYIRCTGTTYNLTLQESIYSDIISTTKLAGGTRDTSVLSFTGNKLTVPGTSSVSEIRFSVELLDGSLTINTPSTYAIENGTISSVSTFTSAINSVTYLYERTLTGILSNKYNNETFGNVTLQLNTGKRWSVMGGHGTFDRKVRTVLKRRRNNNPSDPLVIVSDTTTFETT
jgi:hypothetical protein